MTPEQQALADKLTNLQRGVVLGVVAGKYYVYHLIDPRTGKVFYVGKGSGDRIFHHERDARNMRFMNAEKEFTIREIWMAGLEVIRKIEKTFDLEAEAYIFEKQEIDRIGIDNLTNLSRGGEPEEVKAMRRGEAFIKKMNASMDGFSESQKILAMGLIREMEEAVNLCKRVLGREVAA